MTRVLASDAKEGRKHEGERERERERGRRTGKTLIMPPFRCFVDAGRVFPFSTSTSFFPLFFLF